MSETLVDVEERHVAVRSGGLVELDKGPHQHPVHG